MKTCMFEWMDEICRKMELKKADVFGHIMSKRSSDARKFLELDMIEGDPFAFYGAYLDFLRKPL